MSQPKQRRKHRIDVRLNDEELELITTGMQLCNYTRLRVFARDVLCGFSMRAITRYTTPKIVNDVLTESINDHSRIADRS